MESLLLPFFKVLGESPEVVSAPPYGGLESAPFGVLTIGVSGRRVLGSGSTVDVRALQLPNETGAAQIIQETERGLVIGILNQYRYWTPSRARLLAAEILQNHTAYLRKRNAWRLVSMTIWDRSEERRVVKEGRS